MPLPPGAIDYYGPLSLETPAPLQPARYVRNGLVPHATFESHLATSLNFVAASRPKELFRYYGNVSSIPTGTPSARTRWRFAAHTGPQLRQLRAVVVALPSDKGATASAKLYITNATASTTYATGEFVFGSTLGTSAVPSAFVAGEIVLTGVPADTDIYGRFEDLSDGRLISASVVEEYLPLLPGNGYVLPPQVPVKGPIYDNRYEDELTLARNVWRRGAAHLLNWSSNTDATAPTTTSSSYKNIVNNSSTSVSAASPGYYLDLRYCCTRARSAVPVKMWAYGSTTSGSSNEVGLFDASGTLIGSINGFSSTPGWLSTTIDMSSNGDKYDIMFKSNGSATFSVNAVSIGQYAT